MAEADALWISDNIRDWHRKFGFIHETKFTTPSSTTIEHLTGNGDAAIWTGCYLAAEAFRYAIKPTPAGFAYLNEALRRVRDVSTMVPSGFITRTIFPKITDPDDPDYPLYQHFWLEEHHSELFDVNYNGVLSQWVGHPTRDQYAGVLFGLGVTYELITDAGVRAICKDTITHLIRGLIDHAWIMSTPGHPFQETYLIRPDHLLSVLQLGKYVNPSEFASTYDITRFMLSWAVGLPIWYDCLNVREQYYKFNLDYLYCYNLIHYESSASQKNKYLQKYQRLRTTTKQHLNAHFNMIDRALTGPDATRDAETLVLLDQLWSRGFRDLCSANLPSYPLCGGEACDPIPPVDRPYTDFMWQRSPFHVDCVADGSKESAGIDYILPYWMARYFGLTAV